MKKGLIKPFLLNILFLFINIKELEYYCSCCLLMVVENFNVINKIVIKKVNNRTNNKINIIVIIFYNIYF